MATFVTALSKGSVFQRYPIYQYHQISKDWRKFSTSVRRVICFVSEMENGKQMTREQVADLIPPLSPDAYKGQAGKIAVIGGCKEYTGAPYFAAFSALKVGADLSHVFCTEEAGPVIKGYSPELIVHPYLKEEDEDVERFHREFAPWMDKFGCVVIGPGLGRNPSVMDAVSRSLVEINSRGIPIVIDADGLWMVTMNPEILSKRCRNQKSTIVLTPNAIEYARLASALHASSPDEVQERLGGPVIVCKGKEDAIIGVDGCRMTCNEEGSLSRVGGMGDILSGSIATFIAWNRDIDLAAYAGCYIARQTAKIAFSKHGRAMGATDMIAELGHVISSLERTREA
jgi:ATP-dependent NAD(P)H-hydrate dehydratase